MSIKEFIWTNIPDFNTFSGFVFYSLLVYAVIMIMSWFAQPALEESMREEILQRK
eukprot:CAMPEP_0170480776 /NCGR_PEP_ID=MMETSP0208-20121228/1482_1 /TAXON_ID=197538 /ORGANISM="Strombidium inclinatum, Strain S3" /LENGTH=54 /DNA_ID=CAMNT_0010753373 /DNA_START=14 /DNA_END=175 /DNA_ORIENTATION=+